MLMKYFFANVVLNEKIHLIDIYKEKINLPLLKKLKVLSFIVYNNFDVAIRLVTTQLDFFMLGRLFGAELVSVYKITKESSKIILKVSSPVYQSVYPEFTKLIAENKFKLAKSICKKNFNLCRNDRAIFLRIILPFGEMFISITFGDEMIQAYSVSMIYLFVVIFILVSTPLPSLMHAMNLAKQAFYNQFKRRIIYILTLYYLVSEFSIYGAAYSMLVLSFLLVYRINLYN